MKRAVPRRKGDSAKNTGKSKAVPVTDPIAITVGKERNVSKHFTDTGKRMPAIRRVSVDFMEGELVKTGKKNRAAILRKARETDKKGVWISDEVARPGR